MVHLDFPKLSSSASIEEVGKRDGKMVYFVLDPDMPSWVFVNEDGLEILKLCNGANNSEAISSALADRGGNGTQLTADTINSFLESMKRSRILDQKEKIAPTPANFSGVAVEITRQCNLRCAHCYLAAGKAGTDELLLSEIKDLIRATKRAGGVSITIGGGEPMLRKDCLEIIRFAAHKGLLISLGTNGTLIDKKTAEVLAELPIKIQISLDGSRKTHDYIRGKGSYDAVVAGIDNLIQVDKGKDIVVAFTPMKPNINELTDIIDFTLQRDIKVLQFPPLTSSGRAIPNWNTLKLSNKEMIEFWEVVSLRTQELKGRMDLLADCASVNINKVCTHHRCSIGTQLRVDPDGFVYPCQCFHYGDEYCLGNIRQISLDDIVQGQKLFDIKDICYTRPAKIDKCSNCKWRNFCGSGCMGNVYESSGTIYNPEHCEVRKKWIEMQFEQKRHDILL